MSKDNIADGASSGAWIGRGLLGVILSVYTLYAWYLASHLPVFPVETSYMGEQGRVLFSTIWRLWEFAFNSEVIVARGLSILCALVAILLTYRIGAVVSGDHVSGAFLALSFILFPSIVGIFSLATPHALVAMLILAAIVLILKNEASLKLSWRTAAAAILALAAILAGVDEVPEGDFGGRGSGSIWNAMVKPYAMLWAGIFLGIAALGSACLRKRIGYANLKLIFATTATALFFLIGMASLGVLEAGQLLSAVGYIFAVAVLGALPLIMWVRFEMPKVRSIVAWIVFPVIMYSGFWAVLGPIDGESFPYSAIGAAKSGYFIDFK